MGFKNKGILKDFIKFYTDIDQKFLGFNSVLSGSRE